jgi:hypothetical protein
MTGRITVAPVSQNQFSLSGNPMLFTAPAAGVDAAGTGGTAFATAWGANLGIQFINNGSISLLFWNGAAASVMRILVGRKVAGQLPIFSYNDITVAASSTAMFGPWSPQDYTQQDAAAYGGASAPGGAAPNGAIGAGGVGFMCIDFTVITNLSVRLIQSTDVSP